MTYSVPGLVRTHLVSSSYMGSVDSPFVRTRAVIDQMKVMGLNRHHAYAERWQELITQANQRAANFNEREKVFGFPPTEYAALDAVNRSERMHTCAFKRSYLFFL